MAIKLNKDGSVDKRWKPQTDAEWEELYRYNQMQRDRELKEAQQKLSDAYKSILKGTKK